MPLVTALDARVQGMTEEIINKRDAKTLLKESAQSSIGYYDVFLSHSKMDARQVLGAKRILQKKGYSVYVDWIEDPQLDRSHVNKTTADTLRRRMRSCKLMFYLHTTNSRLSKWCPWELGYFDGYTYPTPRVFVFPLLETGEKSFKGQEYLALYPLVDIDHIEKSRSDKGDVWSFDPDSSQRYRRMSNILEEARL